MNLPNYLAEISLSFGSTIASIEQRYLTLWHELSALVRSCHDWLLWFRYQMLMIVNCNIGGRLAGKRFSLKSLSNIKVLPRKVLYLIRTHLKFFMILSLAKSSLWITLKLHFRSSPTLHQSFRRSSSTSCATATTPLSRWWKILIANIASWTATWYLYLISYIIGILSIYHNFHFDC